MIRWSLVEQEYEKDIFAETAWRPQLAILAVLTEFMQRRIDAGELRGERAEAGDGLPRLRLHARAGAQEVSRLGAARGDPDEALRFYIDVFLNGVRNS